MPQKGMTFFCRVNNQRSQKRWSITDHYRLSIGATVVMTGTQGQVQAVREGPYTEGEQWCHVVCLKKCHRPCGETTQHSDPTEAFR